MHRHSWSVVILSRDCSATGRVCKVTRGARARSPGVGFSAAAMVRQWSLPTEPISLSSASFSLNPYGKAQRRKHPLIQLSLTHTSGHSKSSLQWSKHTASAFWEPWPRELATLASYPWSPQMQGDLTVLTHIKWPMDIKILGTGTPFRNGIYDQLNRLKTLRTSLKKLNTSLPYDPAISLLGEHQKNWKQGLKQTLAHPYS